MLLKGRVRGESRSRRWTVRKSRIWKWAIIWKKVSCSSQVSKKGWILARLWKRNDRKRSRSRLSGEIEGLKNRSIFTPKKNPGFRKIRREKNTRKRENWARVRRDKKAPKMVKTMKFEWILKDKIAPKLNFKLQMLSSHLIHRPRSWQKGPSKPEKIDQPQKSWKLGSIRYQHRTEGEPKEETKLEYLQKLTARKEEEGW